MASHNIKGNMIIQSFGIVCQLFITASVQFPSKKGGWEKGFGQRGVDIVERNIKILLFSSGWDMYLL